MRFLPTPLAGVHIVEPEPVADARGIFVRTWCADEFAAAGLETAFVQCSTCYNPRSGTLRGMHYQAEPWAETRLVRCTAGAVWDVVLDLRRDSATFGRWHGVRLDAEGRRAVYIPPGCAHGFQTLTDHAEVFYHITPSFTPSAARGVRWDDPAFAIEWPLPVTLMSARDRELPAYQP